MFKETTPIDRMSPLVDRALHDEELRRNVLRAFHAARKVYGELSGQDALGAANRFSRDDGLRDQLDTAVQNLSEAVVRVSGRKPRSERSWMPFFVIVAAMFLFFNPATGASTRKWAKDHLFGSEEEFDYATPEYDSGNS